VSSGEVLSFRQINAIGSCKFRSDLEEEVGFKLFDRLPRGVKINAAGKSLLDDARHILQEVNDATARAKRIAAGQSSTLRLGYVQIPFIWFPRRSGPVFFDHLVAECARGGLSAPHIVQESADESILLSFVACGVGVAIVSGSSQWRHPQGVSLLARDRSEFAAAYRVDLAKGRYFTATHQFHGRRKSAG